MSGSCASCGTPRTTGRFCTRCGTEHSAGDPGPTTAPAANRVRGVSGRPAVVVLAAALVVLVAVGATVLLLSRADEPSPAALPVPAPSTTPPTTGPSEPSASATTTTAPITSAPSTTTTTTAPPRLPTDGCTADELGRPLEARGITGYTVTVGRCEDGWAYIYDETQAGDTEQVLQALEGTWTVYTGFPTARCPDEVAEAGAPQWVQELFAHRTEECSPTTVEQFCDDIVFEPNSESFAREIVAVGVTCEDASALVAEVEALEQIPATFEAAGFECGVFDVQQDLPVNFYVCTRDDASVSWEN